MKTFNKFCAQGDVYIQRLDDNFEIPAAAKEVQPENGVVIVTHSETGHHHVMTAEKTKMFQLPDSLQALLVVEDDDTLTHLRNYDTHEPISFKSGKYLVRRQREHSPEGWRQVQD